MDGLRKWKQKMSAKVNGLVRSFISELRCMCMQVCA